MLELQEAARGSPSILGALDERQGAGSDVLITRTRKHPGEALSP
jgi:hypothetical protein